MTLPRVLSKALRQSTHGQSSRYVFSLDRWSIERSNENSLIVTLATADGFHVSFAIPFDACCAMGWALGHQGKSAIERDDFDQPAEERRLVN